mgnify:CR=1 FL=1
MTGITKAEALAMLADAFNEPLESVTPETLRDSLPGWNASARASMAAEQIGDRQAAGLAENIEHGGFDGELCLATFN